MTNEPVENVAPHSVDAEEAVLGSILINPEVLFEVGAFLQAADFFIIRNGWIYEAIQAVAKRGEAIDNLTVIQELRNRGQLEGIGGSAYITRLTNNTPTHIHAETYGRIVERAALRRRLLVAASEIAQAALEENTEIHEVLDKADATLQKVSEKNVARDMLPSRLVASRFFDRVESIHMHPESAIAIPTGFREMDRLLGGGLFEGTLNIVAARPGMGKTAFMLNLAQNCLRRKECGDVALFSLEMTEWQLMLRLMSAETGIDSERIKSAQMNDGEWTRFLEATARVEKYRLWIDDTAKPTVSQIRAKCRKLAREGNLRLVIIDYLQLIKPENKRDPREQQVSQISQSLKELTREFKVPFLVAAQLNRAIEMRKDNRPQLSDLRESGSIEADADVVIGIGQNKANESIRDFIFLKHRDGKPGTVSLYFKGELTRFTGVEKRSLDVTALNGGSNYGS